MTVFEHNFESDTLKNTEVIDNNRWLFLDATNQVSPNFTMPPLPEGIGISFLNSIKSKRWLRATATFLAPTKEGTDWSMTQFIIEFRKGNETLRSNMVRPHRLMGDGEKRTIWLDAKVPKGDFDNVNVRFWNAGGNKKMLIDDLKVQTFN